MTFTSIHSTCAHICMLTYICTIAQVREKLLCIKIYYQSNEKSPENWAVCCSVPYKSYYPEYKIPAQFQRGREGTLNEKGLELSLPKENGAARAENMFNIILDIQKMCTKAMTRNDFTYSCLCD